MDNNAGTVVAGNALSGLRRRLLVTASQFARDVSDAEDLVQNALARYWECRLLLREDTNPAAWMTTVIKHLAFDEGRRHSTARRNRELVREWTDVGPRESVPWEHLGIEQVREAARSCSQPVCQAFEMFYLDGLSLQTIGERFGVSPGTVATRLHRARRRIRAVLEVRLREMQTS
jgi:RNA polymerase sigma-70 factor, ECF subfamily